MEEAAKYNEREYQMALAQDRNEAEEEPETITAEQSSRPDFVAYMFLEGLVGLPGDLLKFIPLVGTILALPFSLIMIFIEYFKGKGFKNPVEKITKHSLTGWIPFSNTYFLTSCYIEETKIGKSILGKIPKPTKVIGK
jgi:hypothetical protein